jgi:hypothetical protein
MILTTGVRIGFMKPFVVMWRSAIQVPKASKTLTDRVVTAGWNRLAQHIADAQDEPLEYANLAIRGMRMKEIRVGQLDDALAMKPDLLSIFGGVNDLIAPV